jgi:predicted nucleic acid-binding protein
VVLDTCVFVYQLEANPKYLPLTRPIFVWLEQSESKAITSTVAMTELLVQPYRDQDIPRVDNCYALLSVFPNLVWAPTTLEIADVAARIRAEYRLKTPDALMAATAVVYGTTGIVTNDASFRRVKGLEPLLLDEHL